MTVPVGDTPCLDAHATINPVGQGGRDEDEVVWGAAVDAVRVEVGQLDGADGGGADRGRGIGGQQDQQYERQG
ncbi:MAG: hypothetical protein HYS12_01345 [Planctomycetes bacterium]|nr:hypothetical protein [Planctomycetota bacterium]